jgi:hypothetical protein
MNDDGEKKKKIIIIKSNQHKFTSKHVTEEKSASEKKGEEK